MSTDETAALTARIEAAGTTLHELVNDIKRHIGDPGPGDVAFNPQRWAAMGATDLQTGLMFLTRALGRTDSF
ncbi:MAG: hypothetical protein RIB67_07420 [Miltoncostaeaceae bacterium]